MTKAKRAPIRTKAKPAPIRTVDPAYDDDTPCVFDGCGVSLIDHQGNDDHAWTAVVHEADAEA